MIRALEDSFRRLPPLPDSSKHQRGMAFPPERMARFANRLGGNIQEHELTVTITGKDHFEEVDPRETSALLDSDGEAEHSDADANQMTLRPDRDGLTDDMQGTLRLVASDG